MKSIAKSILFLLPLVLLQGFAACSRAETLADPQMNVRTTLSVTKMTVATTVHTPGNPSDWKIKTAEDLKRLRAITVRRISWNLSTVVGTYGQTCSGKEVEGKILGTAIVKTLDNKVFPALGIEGRFFVERSGASNTDGGGKVKFATRFKPELVIKEQVASSPDGSRKIFVAEGTQFLVLDPRLLEGGGGRLSVNDLKVLGTASEGTLNLYENHER